mmetsp:Transcript_120444/g.239710  ORF Transcript_120444/g.239710 Transcript_120444/m.239710 type:complete len:752 (+) Transcript_120444:87-2342(+)
MKFGKQLKQLADPTHLGHCIAYDTLKKAIGVVVAADRPTSEDTPSIRADMEALEKVFGQSTPMFACQPPDSRFHGLLQHELEKVNRFAALQFRTLLDTLREAQRPLLRCLSGSVGAGHEDLGAGEAERLLDAAADQLMALEGFRVLNFAGFRKIAKKFDKRSKEAGTKKGNLATWFIPQLLREFFVATPLDVHLLALARGYAALRRRRNGSMGQSVPMAPATSRGCTTTYWLTTSARMRALCTLVKRFDVVLPPSSNTSFIAALPDTPLALAEQQQTLLQSIGPEGIASQPCRLASESNRMYLDGPDFSEYLGRLRQGDQDEPIGFHVRWSAAGGAHAGAGGGELVERGNAASALGPHAFMPVETLVVPEAFPVKDCTGSHAGKVVQAAAALLLADLKQPVSGVVKPQAHALAALDQDGRDSVAAFAREVHAAAQRTQLGPVATVTSSRTLLRGDTPATVGVAIALDEDIQFSKDWSDPNDVVDFPYCLVEVACNDPESTGGWLDELRSHAALRSVANFSIGAHAVAVLHKDKVPELPHWHEHLSSVEAAAPPETWGLMLEWRAANLEPEQAHEEQLGASAGGTTVKPEAAPPPVVEEKERLDSWDDHEELAPKNLLATERTMLEWMHTVYAFALLGIGMWRFSLTNAADGVQPAAFGLLNIYSTASTALGCYSLALIMIAIGFGWYAALHHRWRLRALRQRRLTEQIFNSRLPPVLLAALMGIALAVHIAVQTFPLLLSPAPTYQDFNDD